MKILVFGAAGQLGTAIAERFGARASVIRATRADVDLGATAAVERFVTDCAPDVLINCAAYNNVDGAEDNPVDAITVNAIAVRALSRGAVSCGATFVHYGTDFVFDGLADRPYVEEDEPAPQSVYASSKLLGEWFAADVPRHYVLRVESLFGGSARRSSVDRIADAVRNGQPSRVFVDRAVTASFVNDVADATWHLLASNGPPGLYHCVNSGVTTWHDLAQEIARILGVDAELVPVTVAEVPMKAKRPQYAALSNAKLARAGFEMPAWQDALRRYLAAPRTTPC
jgi:dTDP-4-dehydrorhamnose reductase